MDGYLYIHTVNANGFVPQEATGSTRNRRIDSEIVGTVGCDSN